MNGLASLRSFKAPVTAALLTAVLTLAAPVPAQAAARDELGLFTPPAPLHAGISSYLSGMATRSRVIQLCVVCMGIALFIIMKKFADGGPGGGPPARPVPPSVEDSQR